MPKLNAKLKGMVTVNVKRAAGKRTRRRVTATITTAASMATASATPQQPQWPPCPRRLIKKSKTSSWTRPCERCKKERRQRQS